MASSGRGSASPLSGANASLAKDLRRCAIGKRHAILAADSFHLGPVLAGDCRFPHPERLDSGTACAFLSRMTPPAESRSESAPAPVPAAPVRVIVPVPPEPAPAQAKSAMDPDGVPAPPPMRYVSGGEIILEHGAVLPTELCVKCGRPACGAWPMMPRHPGRPATWFGRRPVVEMGLCRKHRDDHAVAVALTWSVLAVGALLLVVGMVTLGWVSAGLGLLAMAGAGWFRASSPVVATLVSDSRIVLGGSGEAYRSRISGGDDRVDGD